MTDEREGAFINCAFDGQFKPLFDAMAFTILACGFRVRSALEASDSGELRLEKLFLLIDDCSCSIHDISRVELDDGSGLPRFNMPIELGIALGYKRFASRQSDHRLLMLDSTRYRYQQFASDLAGLDIAAHGNSAQGIIGCVRDFLASMRPGLPTVRTLAEMFGEFESVLPRLAKALRQEPDELTFVDRLRHAEFFLEQAGG